MVAWCIGVLAVPALTAVNGPVFREFIKISTGTLVLRGLLFRHEENDVTSNSFIFHHNLFILGGNELTMCSPSVCMMSLCAAASSHHHTHSANLNQGCTPAAHSELMWDALQGSEERKKRGLVSLFITSFVGLCCKSNTELGLCFTWKGSIDRKDWHTSDFILPSCTVIFPIAGLVNWDEFHWTFAEEILAVNQLLNWRKKEWHVEREGTTAGLCSVELIWHLLPHVPNVFSYCWWKYNAMWCVCIEGGIGTHWSMLL